MLNIRDLEFFKPLAMSFITRGRWSWTRGELQVRVSAFGVAADWESSLANLCRDGWMASLPQDVFCLSDQGKAEARKMVGPHAAGGL